MADLPTFLCQQIGHVFLGLLLGANLLLNFVDLGVELGGRVCSCFETKGGQCLVAGSLCAARGNKASSLLRWSSHIAITSSTTSTGSKRLRWLSLINSGLPPRSVTVKRAVQH